VGGREDSILSVGIPSSSALVVGKSMLLGRQALELFPTIVKGVAVNVVGLESTRAVGYETVEL
jgi:hypothetical protein